MLPGVTEVKFAGRLQEIHDKIHLAAVPGYAGLQLSVSIGGTIAGADETIGSVVEELTALCTRRKPVESGGNRV